MTTEPVLKPYQEKIIALMLRQETLLARLYQIFSRKFPEHADFWNKLARDEEKHAGWLEQLREATEKKVMLFNEGRIKTYTLETFVQGLEEKIERAEADGFDTRQALICTIDLERSLIEKNVFSLFEGMTEKASRVMKFLAQETKNHQELAQKLYLETAKGQAPR
ncbi:MAG: rubrerythrin family protein [Desulfobulbaceae bacterium]|nr:rubrerythrin family protein [Desulfobulbaceae bacterium]HIJ89839.1 rubrerythrin family protein [Deltaproteobacteria bacterium]